LSKRSAPHVQIPPTDWLKFNRLAEAQSASHFPGPSVLTFRQQPAHQGQIPRMKPQRSVLFCRCAFARVVPDDVKNDVLKHLVHSAEPFDAVGDLCEMSARKDPTLIDLAAQGNLTVIACYLERSNGFSRQQVLHFRAKGLKYSICEPKMRRRSAKDWHPACAIPLQTHRVYQANPQPLNHRSQEVPHDREKVIYAPRCPLRRT